MDNPSSDRYTDPDMDYDSIIASIDVDNFIPSTSMDGSMGMMEVLGRRNKTSWEDEGKGEGSVGFEGLDSVLELDPKKIPKRTSVADLLRRNRKQDDRNVGGGGGVMTTTTTSGIRTSIESQGRIKRERKSSSSMRSSSSSSSSSSSQQYRNEYSNLDIHPSPLNKRIRTIETTTTTSGIKSPRSTYTESQNKPNSKKNIEWSHTSEPSLLHPSSTLHSFGIGSSSNTNPTDQLVFMNGEETIQSRINTRSFKAKPKQVAELGKGSSSSYKSNDMKMKKQKREEFKEFKNEKEVDRFLLNTLGKEGNPLTNSDLYSRTTHVISASTGHQVSNRGPAKFTMPNQTYIQKRNEKLKEQFIAKAGDNDVLSTFEREGNDKSSENNEDDVILSNHLEDKEDRTVIEKIDGKGTSGEMGNGKAFEDWINRGKRPKRIGVTDVKSGIFAGCTIYLNGYTGPRTSDLELKRLIAIHGGNVSYHCTSSCTHILVATGLSGTKAQKFLDASSSTRKGKRKVVHVDWALDSVIQGKKLSETGYNVITNEAQPTLFSSLGHKPRPASGSRGVTSGTMGVQ